jgi:large conductance mechanosensitive channel
MLKAFRDFAMRGNVIDMAVGIIIGAAFGVIVKSLVDDVLMPPIGLLLGGVDMTNLFVVLKDGATPGPYASLEQARTAGAVTLNYGLLINAIVSFLIVAISVFLLVKSIETARGPAPAAVATTKECPQCAMAIPIKATRCPHCTSMMTEARPA